MVQVTSIHVLPFQQFQSQFLGSLRSKLADNKWKDEKNHIIMTSIELVVDKNLLWMENVGTYKSTHLIQIENV